MPPARLWLVRHGQSTWNALGRFQGQADPPLSALGRRQAALLAHRLAGLVPAALYTSDLSRCRDTAEPLAEALGCPATVRADLREIDVGRWSGLTREEIQSTYPAEWARWQRGEEVARGDGETWPELERRVLVAAGELLAAHDGAHVVVVTHGGPIRCLVACALGVSPRTRALGGVANASLTLLRPHAEGLRLETFNDTGHPHALTPAPLRAP